MTLRRAIPLRWMLCLIAVAVTVAARAAVLRRPPPVAPVAALVNATTVQRVLMSTIWRVILPAGSPGTAPDAAERALDEVARLESVLSEWRPGTELSRVNANAGGLPVRVGNDTWFVVERSLYYARISDGAFDPTWAALHGLWDFRTATPTPPSREAVAAKLPLVNWRLVEMDARAQTIRLARQGMALGLGGIAKGYALDRARQILLDAGVRDFVLYSGGQVLAEGTARGRAWRVGIQHPRDDQTLLGAVSITTGSVSTGGDYEHFYELAGRRYHHIIDPRTGFPVAHTVAVTVVARTGLDADALDTALFVMAPERAMALAEQLGVAVLRTDPALRSEASSAMRTMFEARAAVHASSSP